MRLREPINLGLCPKPRFGGNSSIGHRFGMANFGGRHRPQKEKILTPSTLERRTPVLALG